MRYRWFADDEKPNENRLAKAAKEALKENLREQYEMQDPKKITRGELSALLLAVVASCYGFVMDDLPLMFAALSLVIFFMKPLAYHLLESRAHALANVMQGFSIAIFLGAIVMVLI